MQTSEHLVDLLRRIARQDRGAFELLYEATSAKMFGVALRIVARRDLAEEALQDAYVKIWNQAASFDPAKGSPITWMVTIVRNRALDEVRRKTPVAFEDMPPGFDPHDEARNPAEAHQRNELLRALLQCLGGLEPKHRSMILLAYYHGASREALASRFDAPVATIKTWLHRSLARLRECLST